MRRKSRRRASDLLLCDPHRGEGGKGGSSTGEEASTKEDPQEGEKSLVGSYGNRSEHLAPKRDEYVRKVGHPVASNEFVATYFTDDAAGRPNSTTVKPNLAETKVKSS